MGFLSSSPSTPPPPASIKPDPTSRSSRDKCYAARDAFFACLDFHNITDALNSQSGESQLATQHCGGLDEDLKRDCTGSWVVYFKQRRVMEARKAETLERLRKEGAEKVPGVMPGAPSGSAKGSGSGDAGAVGLGRGDTVAAVGRAMQRDEKK